MARNGKICLLMAVALTAPIVAPARALARHYVHHYTAHHGYGPRYGRHYTNVDGNSIHSPMQANHRPAGATAHCVDGSWSFSQHARGTCSHHGGVGGW
ncbi:DUF3761 domain-containing protein [Novosphingobium sp. Fuku2-ISO-50]|uniref:DUF3761 domain-containing protein n=1 Tax=Novosphingobium sp. Fuku2-ISO-50 TaxID=1739114 RepID=UPI00350FD339